MLGLARAGSSAQAQPGGTGRARAGAEPPGTLKILLQQSHAGHPWDCHALRQTCILFQLHYFLEFFGVGFLFFYFLKVNWNLI